MDLEERSGVRLLRLTFVSFGSYHGLAANLARIRLHELAIQISVFFGDWLSMIAIIRPEPAQRLFCGHAWPSVSKGSSLGIKCDKCSRRFY